MAKKSKKQNEAEVTEEGLHFMKSIVEVIEYRDKMIDHVNDQVVAMIYEPIITGIASFFQVEEEDLSVMQLTCDEEHIGLVVYADDEEPKLYRVGFKLQMVTKTTEDVVRYLEYSKRLAMERGDHEEDEEQPVQNKGGKLSSEGLTKEQMMHLSVLQQDYLKSVH